MRPKGETPQPIDPYTRAKETLDGLLTSGAYSRTKIYDAFEKTCQAANCSIIGEVPLVRTKPMHTELHEISEKVEHYAERNHDQKYAEYYRVRAESFQSVLKLIDSQRAQKTLLSPR
ncbi:MAG: hypothetical protein Q7K55_03375 [Candidatus Levybacteria bacterium]|nr:hypothetical protein [Candidatus Levybacteria bacterium]